MWQSFLLSSLETPRWFQIMGITKRGGQCSAGIYLHVSELNIKISEVFDTVPEKLNWTKKPPENLSITLKRHKTSTNSSVRYCFQQRHVLVRMAFGDSPGIAWSADKSAPWTIYVRCLPEKSKKFQTKVHEFWNILHVSTPPSALWLEWMTIVQIQTVSFSLA